MLPIPENLDSLLQERDRIIDACLPYLDIEGRKVLQEYLMDGTHSSDIWVPLKTAQEWVLAVLVEIEREEEGTLNL